MTAIRQIWLTRDRWDHHGHRELFDVTSALRVNFYEDWRTGDSVSEALDDVGLFVGKLQPLLFEE